MNATGVTLCRGNPAFFTSLARDLLSHKFLGVVRKEAVLYHASATTGARLLLSLRILRGGVGSGKGV